LKGIICAVAEGFNDIGILTEGKEYQLLEERKSFDEEIGYYDEVLIVDNTGDKRWFESYRFGL